MSLSDKEGGSGDRTGVVGRERVRRIPKCDFFSVGELLRPPLLGDGDADDDGGNGIENSEEEEEEDEEEGVVGVVVAVADDLVEDRSMDPRFTTKFCI